MTREEAEALVDGLNYKEKLLLYKLLLMLRADRESAKTPKEVEPPAK